MNARKLARLVAVQVAKGQYDLAVESVHMALDAARKEAEPRLVELEAEVAKLRKCVAHHYTPLYREWEVWQKYCDDTWAAGGTPPDEDEWRVELALAALERRE